MSCIGCCDVCRALRVVCDMIVVVRHMTFNVRCATVGVCVVSCVMCLSVVC